MTNPFAGPPPNQFFVLAAEEAASVQQTPGHKMIADTGLQVGSLATVSWKLHGYETEIESIMGVVEKIDANSITIDDVDAPIEQLHKIRIHRTELKPKERATHADVVALVDETGGDPEAAFNAVWDMPEDTTGHDPFAEPVNEANIVWEAKQENQAPDQSPAPAVGQPTIDGVPVDPSMVFPHTMLLSDDHAQRIIDSGAFCDDATTEENPFA